MSFIKNSLKNERICKQKSFKKEGEIYCLRKIKKAHLFKKNNSEKISSRESCPKSFLSQRILNLENEISFKKSNTINNQNSHKFKNKIFNDLTNFDNLDSEVDLLSLDFYLISNISSSKKSLKTLNSNINTSKTKNINRKNINSDFSDISSKIQKCSNMFGPKMNIEKSKGILKKLSIEDQIK